MSVRKQVPYNYREVTVSIPPNSEVSCQEWRSRALELLRNYLASNGEKIASQTNTRIVAGNPSRAVASCMARRVVWSKSELMA